MGMEDVTLTMDGENEKRGGFDDGNRMSVEKEKVFLDGAVGQWKKT